MQLRQAEFVKRYKRFFADVRLDGETVVAHVPNTGSLKTCLFEGAPCLVSESTNPARKLKATLHFIKTPSGWAGVDTSLPNLLVFEAWQARRIPAWAEYAFARREFKISKESRLDMVLAPSSEHFDRLEGLRYIEIKNVTLAEGGTARFPDAETTRGQKHLLELMKLQREGAACEIVFVIQREGCHEFTPADDIDPEYGRLLREAAATGVIVRALVCDIDPLKGAVISGRELPIKI
jgi:sugar fermentation stimulation protein A